MIDPTQLPILMKAIDFVFDEGRKILEERRERRKMNAASAKEEEQKPVTESSLPEPEQEEEIKQDLIASKIDDLLWKNHAEEVEHLVRLLEKHTRAYYTFKEQFAEFGSVYTPPHIVSQMKEKENSIIETRKQLEIVLSKVYKKDIHPNK
jgi:hypothetical protein